MEFLLLPIKRVESKMQLSMNKTGLLIEPKDKSGLRNSLVLLLSDQVLREKLGKQGREWAEKHSWEKLTKKLYSIKLKHISKSRS